MVSSIPIDYMIMDTRDSTYFKKKTISNYRKNDVIKSFKESVINYKLEDACYWMVELHCCGLLFTIMNELFKIYIYHIHLKNPRLLFYIHKNFTYIRKIVKNYKKNYIIFTRNNQEIRNLLVEITAMCTLSKKTNLFINKYFPKIKKENYDSNFIKNNIISINLDLVLPYMDKNNPIEIILVINEILNLLNISNSYNKILYWVLWLKKLTINKNKDGIFFDCFELNNNYTSNLKNNLKTRWEIHLWNIILDKSITLDKKSSNYIIILYNYYIDKINIKNIQNRINYILIALYTLSMFINWNNKLYTHESQTLEVCCNINSLYAGVEKLLIANSDDKNINNRINNYNVFKSNNLIKNTIKNKNKIKNKIIIKKNINNNSIDEYTLKNKKKLNLFAELICYK